MACTVWHFVVDEATGKLKRVPGPSGSQNARARSVCPIEVRTNRTCSASGLTSGRLADQSLPFDGTIATIRVVDSRSIHCWTP